MDWDNYECEGQTDIFDFLPQKQQSGSEKGAEHGETDTDRGCIGASDKVRENNEHRSNTEIRMHPIIRPDI